MIERPILGRI